MSAAIINSLESSEPKKKRPSDPLMRSLRNVGKKPGKVPKLRIKLPPVDSFEKDLEYPCDAPGRVVVRLERLLGTDKVKITDRGYMRTLLRKLEEEETGVWNKRNRLRRKLELDRSKQLAIDGKIEPGPEMGDLYKHPVFRVNRIIQRLGKMDATMSTMVALYKLPPIVPVEPFEEYDRTGILFGFHKDHYLKVQGRSNEPSFIQENVELTSIPSFTYRHPLFDKDGKLVEASQKNDVEIIEKPGSFHGHFVQELEWEGEGAEHFYNSEFDKHPSSKQSKSSISDPDEISKRSISQLVELIRKGNASEASLQYKQKYQQDLEKAWQIRRSHLIDLLYQSDELDPNGLYGLSKKIVNTYRREQRVVDSFIRDQKVNSEDQHSHD